MPQPDKPPTLADVARLAGVSVPAASRVLNGGVRGRQSGSAAMRERVEAAAAELGYSVSRAAQAIKDGRARTIAFVVPDIDDFGSASMISGVMHAAERRGLSVAVRTTRDDPAREIELLAELRGERHRAVVVATSRTTDAVREAALEAELRMLDAQGTRVVLVGDSSFDFPTVTTDNRRAAERLAHALARAGRSRFAIVSGPAGEVTAEDRVAGFLAGLAPHGIAPDEVQVVHADFTRDGGYHALAELVDRLAEIDVIAAMSDTMAVGVIARLREVGADAARLEVTGFDHVPLLGDLLPEFSTVEVPLERFGEAAIALALDAAAPAGTVRVLEAVPIVRGVRLTA